MKRHWIWERKKEFLTWEVEDRWWEQLQNDDKLREIGDSESSGSERVDEWVDCREAIMSAVKKFKGEKASWLNGIAVQVLKYGSDCNQMLAEGIH